MPYLFWMVLPFALWDMFALVPAVQHKAPKRGQMPTDV
jgi:hypothetical protein